MQKHRFKVILQVRASAHVQSHYNIDRRHNLLRTSRHRYAQISADGETSLSRIQRHDQLYSGSIGILQGPRYLDITQRRVPSNVERPYPAQLKCTVNLLCH